MTFLLLAADTASGGAALPGPVVLVLSVVLDLLSAAALVFGLFFLFVGALGIFRLPDVYNRLHAASKSITLGVIGMLTAAVLHLAVPDADYSTGEALAGVAKAFLVIAFQFVAAPVASHMLAKAAHADEAEVFPETKDEMTQDHDDEAEAREHADGY